MLRIFPELAVLALIALLPHAVHLGHVFDDARPPNWQGGQGMMMTDGGAQMLLTATEAEYLDLLRDVRGSPPYVQLAVMDELSARTNGDETYAPITRAIRTPSAVLKDLLMNEVVMDGVADHSILLAAGCYKAGVVRQSTYARRVIDNGELAERYRARIVGGLADHRQGPRGLQAMRELLSFWPPLGATLEEFRDITGVKGNTDATGRLEVIFDDGRGLSATIVRCYFEDGRLSRVSFAPGA